MRKDGRLEIPKDVNLLVSIGICTSGSLFIVLIHSGHQFVLSEVPDTLRHSVGSVAFSDMYHVFAGRERLELR